MSNVLQEAQGRFSRRDVLAGSAGLTFAFALGAVPFGSDEAAAQAGGGRLNAYVNIAPDGTITIFTPAPEMGQAVNTALPLIIAEELDADWTKVRIEQSPIAPVYNHPIFKSQYVVASLTVRGYWMPLRIAGAQARRVLIHAAAQHWGIQPAEATPELKEARQPPTQVWGVPPAELITEASVVIHRPTGRRLSYGEIASFAKVPKDLPQIKPEDLKPVSQFRLIGKDVPRYDVPAKSTGKLTYASDVQVPGMLYGTLARAPVRGSGPTSFNREEIKKQPGIVEAVALDHGVVIIGNTVEAVFNARGKLKAQWREAKGSQVNSDADLKQYLAHVRDPARKGVPFRNVGDAPGAIAKAARVISGEFMSDYVYHAQMEPLSCTASVTPEGVEVWAATQWPTRSVAEAAKAAGVAPDKVKLHLLQMGGGFGRRAFIEYVIDAVLLSKAVGKPVKMIQSREDDIAAARMRPLTAQKVDVGLDANGKVIGWRQRLAAEPVAPYIYDRARLEAQKGVDIIVVAGADVAYYDVPAELTEHIYEEREMRVAAWRGIGAGYTTFAVEAMIDELAREAGKDPLEYRVALLKDPRARKVVERAAQMADWGRKREGRALGVAFGKLGAPPVGFSMAGTVAEISLDRASGNIRVHNLWCAVDAGLPVQPDNIVAQTESCLAFSLGAALKERITVKDGRVEQTNFHDYPILRLSETPEIKIEVIRSGDIPLPIGELGIGGTAPAIANAFLAMTGRRLRHLPFTPERVKAALA